MSRERERDELELELELLDEPLDEDELLLDEPLGVGILCFKFSLNPLRISMLLRN